MKNILYTIELFFITVAGCQAVSQGHKAVTQQMQEYPVAIQAFYPVIKMDSDQISDVVKKYFEKRLVHGNFNGGVIVAKGGSIIYEEYSGLKDLRKDELLDARSPLHIASVSKTITSAAILKLAQDGKLRLGEPISDFFPVFPYSDVTVCMLLSHRSGIPNYVHYLEALGWDRNVYATNQDVVNSLYNLHPQPEFKAGTRFSYSNTNFLLLAMIIEKLTGMSYPVYMKTNFFDPLQMNDTHVFTLADTATAIPSYEWNGRVWGWDFLDGTYGDKNIYTTPRDLLKFSLVLSGGNFIRQSLLDSAYMPYSNERPGIHNYGLGWRLMMLKNGKKIIYHNGRWHGSNASFVRLPDEDVTIIIIGNRFDRNIYTVARNSSDLFGDYINGGSLNDDEENGIALKRSYKRPVAKKSHHRKHNTASRSSRKTIVKNGGGK